jgi:Ca-activated chloride channel family protein
MSAVAMEDAPSLIRQSSQPRRRASRFLTCLLLVGVVLIGPRAVNARCAQDGDDEVRLTSDVVLVPFTARDAKGRLVDSLTQDDVSVTVNGETPELAFFERDASSMDALLLLDTSASTGATLETITASALAFVKQLRKGDSFALMTFAEKPEVVHTWTGDVSSARAALSTVKSSGDTYLNMSAQVAIRSMFADRPTGRRRALVVLTDGLDLKSGYFTPQRTSDVALAHDVTIYVVSVSRVADQAVTRMLANNEVEASLVPDYEAMQLALRATESVLSHVAESTGGRVVFPAKDVDLEKAFGQIAEEMRSRYVLGFYAPADVKNGFHPIVVKARTAGVTIRARSGYFTGPYVEMAKPD